MEVKFSIRTVPTLSLSLDDDESTVVADTDESDDATDTFVFFRVDTCDDDDTEGASYVTSIIDTVVWFLSSFAFAMFSTANYFFQKFLAIPPTVAIHRFVRNAMLC